MQKLYATYKPEWPKFRMGGSGDGGYVICDLPVKYGLMLGCGMGNNINFEREFAEKYGNVKDPSDILVHAFDGTIAEIPGGQPLPNMEFHQKNISPIPGLYHTTLREYENHKNIFLKMDIERHEWTWFNIVSDNMLDNIAQMVIEFHFPTENLVYPDIFHRIIDKFVIVHVHGNNCCGTYLEGMTVLPNVVEITFVHKRFFTNPLVENDDPVPSVLDEPNVPGDDIDLNHYPFRMNV